VLAAGCALAVAWLGSSYARAQHRPDALDDAVRNWVEVERLAADVRGMSYCRVHHRGAGARHVAHGFVRGGCAGAPARFVSWYGVEGVADAIGGEADLRSDVAVTISGGHIEGLGTRVAIVLLARHGERDLAEQLVARQAALAGAGPLEDDVSILTELAIGTIWEAAYAFIAGARTDSRRAARRARSIVQRVGSAETRLASERTAITNLASELMRETRTRRRAPRSATEVIARRDLSALASALDDLQSDDRLDLTHWMYEQPDEVVPVLLDSFDDARLTRALVDGPERVPILEPVSHLAWNLVTLWMGVGTRDPRATFERYFRGHRVDRGWMQILEDPTAGSQLWTDAASQITTAMGGITAPMLGYRLRDEESPSVADLLERRLHDLMRANEDFCPLLRPAYRWSSLSLAVNREAATHCAGGSCACGAWIQERRAIIEDPEVLEDELRRVRGLPAAIEPRLNVIWANGDDPRVRVWARALVGRAPHDTVAELWIANAIGSGRALAIAELRDHAKRALRDRTELGAVARDASGRHALMRGGVSMEPIPWEIPEGPLRRCDLYGESVFRGALWFAHEPPEFDPTASRHARDERITRLLAWLDMPRTWQPVYP
jgi:hypothetical protein